MLFVLLALFACGDPPVDQLMIEVVDGTDGRLMIPQELDAFEVRVASVYGGIDGGSQRVRWRRTFPLAPREGDAPPGAVTLPQTVAVVPAGDGSGTIRVDVYGLKQGRVLQRLYRTASFGVGLVRLPPFALTPLCFGIVCPEGETCEADGVCRPAESRLDAGRPDAGPCGANQVMCADRCIPYDDANCGACGVACPTDERCIANVCACRTGLARCGTACVNLDADPVNCGTCGMRCPMGEACLGGVCECVTRGGSICDGVCRDLQTEVANCGGCGVVCSFPNGRAECNAGTCRLASCNAGFGDCTAAAGCETVLNTLSDCGACGRDCVLPRARETCAGGSCAIASCDPGWGDCSGGVSNGCETSLDSSEAHCGGCGRVCSPANATGMCSAGSCAIGACNAGFLDCDGNPSNGCEIRSDTDPNHCGACGRTCTEWESCAGGTCNCTGMIMGGVCKPSCGALLAARGAPRGGTSCCGVLGCTTPVVDGMMWASYDCAYCCEAPPGVDACR